MERCRGEGNLTQLLISFQLVQYYPLRYHNRDNDESISLLNELCSFRLSEPSPRQDTQQQIHSEGIFAKDDTPHTVRHYGHDISI